MKWFAIVNPDLSGPAFGVGTSESEALEDAAKWVPNAGSVCVIRITRDSYRKVMRGNPDAWKIHRTATPYNGCYAFY